MLKSACFTLLIFVFGITNIAGQATSSRVDEVTVYSQNGEFYLKTIPFDKEFPTMRGKTLVFRKNSQTPIYKFERGFDSVERDSNNLVLSNNGKIIFYLIPWQANEKIEGLKSITIYENGKIVKSFTESELTKCDYEKERCDLTYSNYNEVIDREKSNWREENFLSNYPVFSFEDTVYVTDSKRNTHIFDLKQFEVETKPFSEIYEQVKGKASYNKVELKEIDAPTYIDFPNLKNGQNTYKSLAEFLGMKPVDISNEKDEQYQWYSFTIKSNILKDGSIEIEESDIGDDLPKEKILEFFRQNKFDSSEVPEIADKWYVGDEYFFLRKADDNLARREKKESQAKRREIEEKNKTAEKINDVYIPKDLGEAFVELDKLLKEVDKNEMKTLVNREEMIRYHHSLGMWMRNNWNLWGISRLQQYFVKKGIMHPENMSSVILYQYYDWLNGDKEAWKKWEKNPVK